MSLPEVRVNIGRRYVEPPPSRKLRLDCQIVAPPSTIICVLDVWGTVVIQGGLVVAEGRIFEGKYARVRPAVIRPDDPGVGVFHIPLSAQAIATIERARAGGDVELSIVTGVLASRVASEDPMVLLAPMETSFATLGSDRVVYPISQSDWVKMLRDMQWSDLELIEIPSSLAVPSPRFQRALARLQDATDCFRRGDWDETLVNCRKTFEAIVQDVAGTTDMSKAPNAFAAIFGHQKKAERVNDLVKELGEFLHLGRHEQPADVKIGRADAAFALHLTAALIRYASEI